MADAGYGRTTQIAYVLSKKADILFRISPNHIYLYDEKGIKLDMAKILKNQSKDTVEIKCFVKHKKQFIPIRITNTNYRKSATRR